jgi:hypothetical protein
MFNLLILTARQGRLVSATMKRSVVASARFDTAIEMKRPNERQESAASFEGIARPITSDETAKPILKAHSEMLAIAFNLIQRPVPSIIEVTNNLRMCVDCRE